jgi:hypothetical protein
LRAGDTLPFAARGLNAGTSPGYRQLVPRLTNMREKPMAFENEPKPTDSYGELGSGLEPSPTKAVIGLAVMIVLGVVLYQVSKTHDTQTSLATPPVTQDVAGNTR